ncbi:MAG TPA: hypothetical protein VFH27_12155 [Longimicrobiaceae bacterium]|nr:hypothetical protein [Longimicrobiaceae bacterium]
MRVIEMGGGPAGVGGRAWSGATVRAIRGLALLPALAAAFLASCSLDKVTIAPGDDLLVVEAVLRTDRADQVVLLHRTLNGTEDPGEPGAYVTIQREGGETLVLREAAAGACLSVDPVYVREDSLLVNATCYTTAGSRIPPPGQALPPFVVPGATYRLVVRTTRGEEALGRTRVPGAYALRGPLVSEAGTSSCVLPPDTNFAVTWSQADSTWSYLARMEIAGLPAALRARGQNVSVPDPFELLGLSVSQADTTVVLPREFGVFDRFTGDTEFLKQLQVGLPPGVGVKVIVAAADRNYVNGVRGGRFNPSGQARISSIAGDGIGVFASMVPLLATMTVRSLRPGDQPCV